MRERGCCSSRSRERIHQGRTNEKEQSILKRFFATIRNVTNVLVEMAGQIFDFHLAFMRHWAARFRRRFVNADAGAFSLADEVDFLKFCRELKKPTDPELQAWREENLDPFEGVTKLYRC